MKYQRIDGVAKVVAGYTGGHQPNPTYEEILDHTEALLIEFDPAEVTLGELLLAWTKMHKPLDPVGNQYRSVVWHLDEDQKDAAERTIREWQQRLGSDLHTTTEAATDFYKAESYHQDYYIRTGQARFVQ